MFSCLVVFSLFAILQVFKNTCRLGNSEPFVPRGTSSRKGHWGFILWSIPTLGDSIYVSFTYIVCFAYLITCKRATVNILASTAALEGLQYKLGSQV